MAYGYRYVKDRSGQESKTSPTPRLRLLLLFLVPVFVLGGIFMSNKREAPPAPIFQEVLGTEAPPHQGFDLSVLVTPSPTPEVINVLPQKTATPASRLPKSLYSVAIFGDSMVDTMGERLDYLETALREKYPSTSLLLYNYGIGGENVEMGLKRIDQPFNYKDRHYPSLSQLRPDILVVASFAYNPFPPHDRNRHWLTLSDLVGKARNISPHVYLLAENAPLIKNFGKGPGGINWPEDLATTQAHHIIEQLENAVGLAKTLNVPLIDVFDKTQVNDQKEGDWRYVNLNDGIHPSVAGEIFTAKIIADTLQFN